MWLLWREAWGDEWDETRGRQLGVPGQVLLFDSGEVLKDAWLYNNSLSYKFVWFTVAELYFTVKNIRGSTLQFICRRLQALVPKATVKESMTGILRNLHHFTGAIFSHSITRKETL